MDAFISRLGVQAVNYAMRCGIALTSSFALQQCSKLVKKIDDKAQQAELRALQKILDGKIKIISPALDLVEFRSGRGNVFLENAATLARALHRDIVALGRQLEDAAAAEEPTHTTGGPFQTKSDRCIQIAGIISAIRRLLERIDSDIPLLQLAITASGESLSTALPPSISPSRLLQASMLLTVGDTQFSNNPHRQPVQIGPVFTLSLYMLFLGHSSTVTLPGGEATSHALTGEQAQNFNAPYGLGKTDRKPIWQEVLHKARVRLCRTPPDWNKGQGASHQPQRGQQQSQNNRVPKYSTLASNLQQDEYAYHLEIIEDLDDGRVHEEGEEQQQQQQQQRQTGHGVRRAGIQESIPICQVSKIFYTDLGRILNIGPADGGQSNAVLLLKRDMAAPVPTQTMEHMQPHPEAEVVYLDTSYAADRAVVLNTEGLPISAPTLPDEEQNDVDRQLQLEINRTVTPTEKRGLGDYSRCESEKMHAPASWRFPAHLDPEWLALEVYAEDEDDEGDNNSEDEDSEDRERDQTLVQTPTEHGSRTVAVAPEPSVDTHHSGQFRNLATPGTRSHSPAAATASGPAPFATQSPFGAVTTSLSLLEMLVRLTGLQEFQQTSHLAIPDHILTFFLEETSATGLRGDARCQAKQAAQQRVGFDPYTDT